jgi:hypothetical protein
MELLNKNILETWSNDGYVQKWLRFVNRKGKKYFFADTQSDYRCKRNGEETYSFYKKTAKRYFVKDGVIIRGLNYRTIVFWLFEDCIVYTDQNGMGAIVHRYQTNATKKIKVADYLNRVLPTLFYCGRLKNSVNNRSAF